MRQDLEATIPQVTPQKIQGTDGSSGKSAKLIPLLGNDLVQAILIPLLGTDLVQAILIPLLGSDLVQAITRAVMLTRRTIGSHITPSS